MSEQVLRLTAASAHRLQYSYTEMEEASGISASRTRAQILNNNGSGFGDAVAGPLRALLDQTADWTDLWPLPPVYPTEPPVPPWVRPPEPKIWVTVTSLSADAVIPAVTFTATDFVVSGGFLGGVYLIEIEFRHSTSI